MAILPDEALPILQAFAPVFTRPTLRRFILLMAAAILTPGRRTVANLIRTVEPLAPGDLASYQRVFSEASWSSTRLALALTDLVIRLHPPDAVIPVLVDDTVTSRPGHRVYGKSRHRDAVRSSHSHTVHAYGHCWVVLAIPFRFPGTNRPLAMPVQVGLYRSPAQSAEAGRRHRTPAQVAQVLLRMLMRRYPGRRFRLAGDAAYGSHEMARFAARHAPALTLVSKFHPEANLHHPAPPYSGRGCPPKKGRARPKPSQVVAGAKPRETEVGWYGGGSRRVGVIGGEGLWNKSGQGLVPIRWVYVVDLDGTHRAEYLFTTDLSLSEEDILSSYTCRWNIETTFQELRSELGLETLRGWCRSTVSRAVPCLFGLYTVVALIWSWLPESCRVEGVSYRGKSGVTFSDMLASVRLWLWRGWVFRQAGDTGGIEKLPQPLQVILLQALAPSA